MRWKGRFRARAMDWPREVLPVPGGPTKRRMGPLVVEGVALRRLGGESGGGGGGAGLLSLLGTGVEEEEEDLDGS